VENVGSQFLSLRQRAGLEILRLWGTAQDPWERQ